MFLLSLLLPTLLFARSFAVPVVPYVSGVTAVAGVPAIASIPAGST
jgi:hypothetical protein